MTPKNPVRRTAKADPVPVRRKASGPRHAAPAGRSAGRTLARLVGPLVLVILTIGVLVVGAFPTRTWLAQRSTAATAESRLAELDAANDAARAEADALRTDSEIERLAREQYGYAKAGEEVYQVLSPARDPVRVPDAWPFGGLGTTIER